MVAKSTRSLNSRYPHLVLLLIPSLTHYIFSHPCRRWDGDPAGRSCMHFTILLQAPLHCPPVLAYFWKDCLGEKSVWLTCTKAMIVLQSGWQDQSCTPVSEHLNLWSANVSHVDTERLGEGEYIGRANFPDPLHMLGSVSSELPAMHKTDRTRGNAAAKILGRL